MIGSSSDARSALESSLRQMSWKQLVALLKTTIEDRHVPVELPAKIRRWLEMEESVDAFHERRALQAWLDANPDSDLTGWFKGKTEAVPIQGWSIEATHVLRDGVRWWIFSAQRHDDKAPLVGPCVPAPASYEDLKKLRRIIDFAGGPRKELLRTGAISQQEHDELVAAGKHEIAQYGQIFYWWKA